MDIEIVIYDGKPKELHPVSDANCDCHLSLHGANSIRSKRTKDHSPSLL